MRKEIVSVGSEPATASGEEWLDLEVYARVRLTSEDPIHPIEGALRLGSGHGWKAVQPGPQTIWIDFDIPRSIREIYLRFEIAERRTQEFVLLASSDGGQSYREIVRQQFNFSPEASTEDELYSPDLRGVTGLKLTVVPDISGGDCQATLSLLRVR